MIDTVRFFNENIQASIGCTEPAAIGLAVAAAFNAIKGRLPDDYALRNLNLPPAKIRDEIKNITVSTDRDVFKNSLQVAISQEYALKGAGIAAALGVFSDPAAELELFAATGVAEANAATSLLGEGKISVSPNYQWDELRIRAEVTTQDSTALAIIAKNHSNLAQIQVNGQVRFKKKVTQDEAKTLERVQRLSGFLRIAEDDLTLRLDGGGEARVLEGALETNHQASIIAEREFQRLKRESLGSSSGPFIQEAYLGNDPINLAKQKVSLAVEGRMTGFNIKVMTCAGSGTMGLVATLPLIVIALTEFSRKHPDYNLEWEQALEVIKEKTPGDWAKLIRAAALVHLIANYVSLFSGKLSASCGCATKVGVGVAAGLSYYLTPEDEPRRIEIIGQAINGMGRSIIGMVCDGGKEGCALKAAVATGIAMESALLACRKAIHSDGIASENAMVTLRRIGEVSKAMEEADKKIIEFLQEI